MSFSQISEEAVMEVLNNLKQKLSCGHDGISSRLLKASKQINFDNLGLLNCIDVYFCYTVHAIFFIHRTIAIQPFHELNVCMCLFVVAITIATAWRS